MAAVFKHFETLYGYQRVLPGACSMVRWEAMQGAPLERLFKLMNQDTIPSCYEANQYLAEDRILCLWMFTKEQESYALHYVYDARCLTDGPVTLDVLLGQRRRWLNSIFFNDLVFVRKLTTILNSNNHRKSCQAKLGSAVLFYFVSLQLFLNVSGLGIYLGICRLALVSGTAFTYSVRLFCNLFEFRRILAKY